MQTEYLNLVTDVQDQFTSPLTRLSGLLETTGTLAERLDPIRINVRVRDRQLDSLNARLAALEGYDLGESFSTSGGVFDDTFMFDDEGIMGESDFETASDLFERSLGDLESSISDTASDISETEIERDAETYIDTVPVMGIGAVGTMNIGFEGSSAVDTLNMGRIAAGGSGGGGGAVRSAQRTVADGGEDIAVTPDLVRNVQEQFGTDLFDQRFLAEDISPAHLLHDAATPFDISSGEMSAGISPRALRRSMKMDDVVEQIIGGDNIPVTDKFDLLGQNLSTVNRWLRQSDGSFNSLTDAVDGNRLQWEKLKESFFDIRIGMTQFYDFLAALMPLMFVFIGSLPAVISALGALGAAALGAAGGLGAIAGLGLMGVAAREAGGQPGFEDITDVLSDIPDEFFSAFRDTADRLAPTFERGLGGLTRLFDELAAREHALIQFTQHAEDFGAWMIPFLANTTEKMLYLASASRDLFSMIAGGIEGRDILGGMAASLERALPYLSSLTALIVDSMPGIVRFSTGMLRMANFIAIAASQVGRIGDLITWITGGLVDGHQALGMAASGFFTLMSAVFLTTKVASIFETKLWRLTGAKAKTILVSKGWIATLHKKIISMKMAGGAAWGLAFAISAVAKAIVAVLAVSVIGVVLMGISSAVVGLTSDFLDLEESVSSSTDALREFDRQQRSMGSGGFHTGEIGGDTYVDVTEHKDYHLEAGGTDDLHSMEERLTWLENSGA